MIEKGYVGRTNSMAALGMALWLLVIPGVASDARAQGPIPDSPTGRMAAALLQLTGSSGEKALQSFISLHLAPPGADASRASALVARLRQMRSDYPDARMRGLMKTGAGSAQLILQSAGGDRIGSVSFEIETDPPYPLISLSIEKGDGGHFGAESPEAQPRQRRETSDRVSAVPVPAAIADRLRRFVAAFNSGDAAVMLAFIDENMTSDFRQRRPEKEDRELYERLRGMIGQLQDVELSMEGDQVRLTATTSDHGDSAELLFEVDAAPTHLIQGYSVSLQKGRPDAGLPPVDMPEGIDVRAFSDRLDRYLAGLADADRFSGSVLVDRHGETVFARAYGPADRSTGAPNRPDTMFDLGSITKIFTKTAVGQLLRDGRLALDDTVLDRLPDYPNRDIGGRITIAHLLDHSSGLGDIFTERYLELRPSLLMPRDFFPLFTGEDLSFEPGAGEQYSNAGYLLLGAIVEAVSGRSYYDYVRDNIFATAGMERSGFVPRDGSDKRVAIGYTRGGPGHEAGPLRPSNDQLPVRGCPAGSSASSAGDLLRFTHALRDGRLLGPEWTEWIYTGRPPDSAADGTPKGRADGLDLSIAGGAPGVNTALQVGHGLTVIVLANLDPPIAQEMAQRIRSAAARLAD